jgi:hypothetical protein
MTTGARIDTCLRHPKIYQPDRLFGTAAAGSCNAGDGYSKVSVTCASQRASCHFGGGFG